MSSPLLHTQLAKSQPIPAPKSEPIKSVSLTSVKIEPPKMVQQCSWCGKHCTINQSNIYKIFCCFDCDIKRNKFLRNGYTSDQVYQVLMLKVTYHKIINSQVISEKPKKFYKIPRTLFSPNDFSHNNKLNLDKWKYLELDSDYHNEIIRYKVHKVRIIQSFKEQMI